MTVKLLEKILPLEGKLNAASVRNNLHEVAQKAETGLPHIEWLADTTSGIGIPVFASNSNGVIATSKAIFGFTTEK